MSSPEQPARRTRAKHQGGAFEGFAVPTSNYFRMPNDWINISSAIDNIAELKVVQYILRHTWGYREYGVKKHITIDEFIRGRKKADGTRIDLGTGLSERAVRYGLGKAVEHGLIEEETDDSDRGRVKKWYGLKMRPGSEDDGGSDPATVRPDPGVQDLQPGVQSLHPQVQGLQGRGAGVAPRTEKDTLERHSKNNTTIGVVDELTEYGVSRGVAKRLVETHSAEYIRQKLDWVRDLAERSPKSVGKNHAGFLTKAIEEDYQPDPGYRSAEQRAKEAEARARREQAAEATIRADEERRAKEREKEQARKEQALKAFRREHEPAQIPGTQLTTETAWDMALERLRMGMTAANYQTWLKDTFLGSWAGSTAIVVAPSEFIVDWLRQRFSALIQKELGTVVGFPVQLEYVVLPELTNDLEQQEVAQSP